jgi:DNA-binding SARP family transcriptional activator/tetratricopeptide (TPR) repeat protein
VTDRTAWLLRLHGAPAVGDAAGQVWRALERKDAGWLAVLAAEGHCPRDRLAAWLWPDSAAATAAVNLRQRIFRLRKQLGHPLVVTGASLALADGIGVLPGDQAWLSSFDYDDCPDFQRWLQQGNERRLARFRDRLRGEVDARQAEGRWAEALRGIEELLALDALSEVDQRRLMRLHHLRGDRAAALMAYQRFQAALHDELGTRPDAETQELLRLIESSRPLTLPAPRRAMPVSLLRPPLLVGRDAALAQCTQAWQAGHVVLLHAEGGMGKTRLLEELAASLGGAAALVGARPGDHEIAYALLVRLLQVLDERIPGCLNAADTAALLVLLQGCVVPDQVAPLSTLRIQAALSALLGNLAPQVSLILLDDLHLADPASLDLMAAVLGSPTRAKGPGWALACRDHEGPAALTHLCTALVDGQRLHRVALQGLDEAALHALVGSLAIHEFDAAELALPLWAHTGGNPQYVLETLKERVLSETAGRVLPSPPSVEALIARRLASLSPSAMLLARVASLAGRSFSVELASAVLQMPALALSDAWAELESAQVLRGNAFAHDLVREAAARGIPAVIAAHQHAAIAQALLAQGASAATVGWHWEQAGDWTKAAYALREAGRHANALGRREDEAGFHERAASSFDRADLPDEAFQSRLDLLALLPTVAGSDRAIALAQQLVSAARSPQQAAMARVHQAHVEMWAMRYESVLVACEAVLAAPRLIDSGLRLRAVAFRSTALVAMGHAHEALASMQQWADQAEVEVDRDAQLVFINHWVSVLLSTNRRRQALELARRQVQLARRVGRPDAVGTALEHLTAAAAYLGHLDEAIDHALEADRLASVAGADAGRRWLGWITLGRMLFADGRYREALERMLPALDGLRLLMPGSAWIDNLECFLADTWLALGQPARAEPLLADRPSQLRQVRAKRLLSRAQTARVRGQPVTSWLHHAQAAALGPASEVVRMQIELESAQDDAPQAALERCEQVRQQAVQIEAVLLVLLADARSLPALVKLGRLDEARSVAQDVARRALVQKGQFVHPPELLLTAGWALRASGDEAGAAQAMTDGAAWVRERAQKHVPAEFVDSFCHRHPVHRQLLLLATTAEPGGPLLDSAHCDSAPHIRGGAPLTDGKPLPGGAC